MAFLGFLAGAVLGGLACYALGASSGWHYSYWRLPWHYYAPAYYQPYLTYYPAYYPSYPHFYRGYSGSGKVKSASQPLPQ